MKDKFWITEAMNGFGTTVEVTEVLHHEITPYQKIDLYQTEKLGRVLLLDGIIQLTEFDEFAYQEMMAHVPLFGCENPEKVLVIGGGDGGVLREIAKHPEVKQMDICEIDRRVIEVAKEFLPSLACGYEDPRVTVHIADGNEYIRNFREYYDVIVVDSTDPGGPGAPLFGMDFYQAMRKAMKPGGVIGTQAESPFLLPEITKSLLKSTEGCFDHCGYGMIFVPTYPTGTIGVCVGGVGVNPKISKRPVSDRMAQQLRYYTKEIHQAAFTLPKFVCELLGTEGK